MVGPNRGTFRTCLLAVISITSASLAIATHNSTGAGLRTWKIASYSSISSGQQQDLPVPFERWTGDLDGMIQRREIRALVVYSKSGFFYDNGRPGGISFEALQELERTVNHKFKTGSRPVAITYMPVAYDQLEESLTSGLGDLIAFPVAITPEREQRAAFSLPAASHVSQIVVTGPKGPTLTNLDDLSGIQIFVNPLSVYYQNLQQLNQSLEAKGKTPAVLKASDQNLGDEDLLEMVNAGLIPATVTTSLKAQFWAKVFDHLQVCSGCVLSSDEQLAWVMRKDSPKLKRLVDQFVITHREGTAFGNTLLRRYLQNTKWVKNVATDEEMKKFHLYVEFFKKYAAQYDFDYLMLVALGYQESQLNQERKSRTGATGIMQVIPKYAAASPIDISNVDSAEANIHAGTKMLREISDTYFKTDRIDSLNKTLFTFASYNAGPNRIAELRKKAASDRLNPDVWFGNVELVVAKNIGQETVRYVSNIYKYYVAYKLVLEQEAQHKADSELH